MIHQIVEGDIIRIPQIVNKRSWRRRYGRMARVDLLYLIIRIDHAYSIWAVRLDARERGQITVLTWWWLTKTPARLIRRGVTRQELHV